MRGTPLSLTWNNTFRVLEVLSSKNLPYPPVKSDQLMFGHYWERRGLSQELESLLPVLGLDASIHSQCFGNRVLDRVDECYPKLSNGIEIRRKASPGG